MSGGGQDFMINLNGRSRIETLSVGSVPGTDHSQIYAFFKLNPKRRSKFKLAVGLQDISAMYTGKRTKFQKKVTCPFKGKYIIPFL